MTYGYHCDRCYRRHTDTQGCTFTEGLNLTPKRIAALELVAGIKAEQGCYVSHVAESVLTSEYRRDHRSGYRAQQATRAGAGYVIPLIKAGLLRKHRTTYGWGTVSITVAGLKALAEYKASNDPANMSLDAVIGRALQTEKTLVRN